MDLYAIRRSSAWASANEAARVGALAKEIADDEFPGDIAWIRSYVLIEEDGSVGSICIYQATSPEAVREHARRVGMPADEITPVAETIVVRPDPVKEPA
jgi:Nickel responsive protein SCO4226-like